MSTRKVWDNCEYVEARDTRKIFKTKECAEKPCSFPQCYGEGCGSCTSRQYLFNKGGLLRV